MPPKPRPQNVLGESLRSTRRTAGLSQDDVARRLDVCRDVVSRWESGGALPRAESRRRLVAFARSSEGSAALRVALGDAPATPPGPPALSAEERKSRIDDALLRAAEELDVRSRALRFAIDRVLRVAADAGLSLGEARDLIGAPVARRDAPVATRRSSS
jgi:transcriptional regulator with XRE-family HTH domain